MPTPLDTALERADRIAKEQDQGAAITPLAHDLVVLADAVRAKSLPVTPNLRADLDQIITDYSPGILNPGPDDPTRWIRLLVDEVERVTRAQAVRMVFACANAISDARPK